MSVHWGGRGPGHTSRSVSATGSVAGLSGAILREDGTSLLREDGSLILREDPVANITAPTLTVFNGSIYTSSATGVLGSPLFHMVVPSDVSEADYVQQQIDTVNTFDSGSLRDEERQLAWDGSIGTSGKLDVDGDSLTASGSASYATVWGTANPTYTVNNYAVGGSGIANLVARQATVLADHPDVFTVLLGSNDLVSGDDSAAVLNYTDTIRAGGAKVGVWTPPPRYIAGNPTATAAHAANRITYAAAIRAAYASGRIDGVIDLTADPIMGPDAAAQDTSLYSDGTHPTAYGYGILATLANPVLDQLFNFGNFVLVDSTSKVPGDFVNQTGLPSSTLEYVRRRFRRDYGDTSIYSPWSSLVNVTLAAASAAVLNTVNGVNKNSTITVSGSPALSFSGASGNDKTSVRTTIEQATSKAQLELTITSGGTTNFSVGIEDGTANLNTLVTPGYSNSTGISVSFNAGAFISVDWNARGNQIFVVNNVAGSIADGDIFTVVYDDGAHTMEIWRTRSGVTTQMGSTATSLPTLSHRYAFASTINSTMSGTLNFGGTTYAKAPGSGVASYWA